MEYGSPPPTKTVCNDPEQIVAALAVACTVNGRPTDKPKLAEEVHPKLSVAVTVYVLELPMGLLSD